MITIKGDKVTITEETTKEVDLTPIRAEIKYLESVEEPSDKELLECARKGEVHDYYKINIPRRLIELREELSQWVSS